MGLEDAIRWRDDLTADPETLGGKPRVRGTRLSVEFILGLFAAGWTTEQVLANYPGLNPESLQAVFAFAAEVLEDEDVRLLIPGTS